MTLKGRCVFTLIVTVVLLAAVAQLSAQTTPAAPKAGWEQTNELAKAASATNPQAIAVLVQQVLDSSPVVPRLSTLTPRLKEALTIAEIRYRTTHKGGVTDIAVARALNLLAKTMSAPAFVYTDRHEVRDVRMHLITLVPALFGSELKVVDQNKGAHVRDEMSPIQAVFLLMWTIQQKAYNPDYQWSPTERRQPAIWAALHTPHKNGGPGARSDEFFRMLDNAGQNVSLRDLAAAMTLVTSSFGLGGE